MLQHQDIPAIRYHAGTWQNPDKDGLPILSAHAWVELAGGIIFESLGRRFYDKADYQRVTNALPFKTYTAQQLARLLDAQGRRPTVDDGPTFLQKMADDAALETLLALSIRHTPEVPAIVVLD